MVLNKLVQYLTFVVSDWDLAEALLDHAFEGYLKTSPGDHPLLLAEPLMTAKVRHTCVEFVEHADAVSG